MLTKYIVSALDGKSYNRTNGHFTRHIRKAGLDYQTYYEAHVSKIKVPCPFCGNSCRLRQADHSYTDTCGSRKCASQRISQVRLSEPAERTALANARRRETTQRVHGVESVSQIASVMQKAMQANSRIVTDDGKTLKQVQQEKTRATKLSRYGDASCNNSKKIKASKGAHTVERKNAINQKRRETCLLLYNVACHLLRPEIVLKSASRTARGNASAKNFTFPSGRKVAVRGFEPMAIESLLEHYDENNIVVHDAYSVTPDTPVLSYVDANRHASLYCPDIYIATENRIIEVKSRWWYDGLGKEKYSGRLENNRRKRAAALAAGYAFEFWVYEIDRSLTVIT